MSDARFGSVLADLPRPGAEEAFEPLAGNGAVRIERIVSHLHQSPPGFWYEQTDDEWVMLVQGAASLAFEDGRTVRLAPGDWAWLPAGCRHRVAHTAEETIWVAVHARPADT